MYIYKGLLATLFSHYWQPNSHFSSLTTLEFLKGSAQKINEKRFNAIMVVPCIRKQARVVFMSLIFHFCFKGFHILKVCTINM